MTRPPLASKLADLGTSIFSEMTRLAAEHRAINLAQGYPDFDGPEAVKEAAIAAIRAGHGQYARTTGIPELHRALSAKYARDYGLEYAADTEITVTSGATEALAAAFLGICDPGDEVVLFEPFYDAYPAAARLAGAVPRVVTLHAPEWHFDPDELASAFSERTRLVVVNTPHNPIGKVFTAAELALIGRMAEDRGAYVLTDEVYEHLVYDGVHVPLATLPGMRERTVTVSSFGKTFSLTGWKIGWVCAPPPLTAAVRAAHQYLTFATATPLQHAAAAALALDRSYYDELLAAYRERRDYLVDELVRLGFDVRTPAGTYFICAGFSRFGFDDDVAFARHLVENVGVAVVPPSAFYSLSEEGKRYVRLAFCKTRATLEAAVERLGKLAVPAP